MTSHAQHGALESATAILDVDLQGDDLEVHVSGEWTYRTIRAVDARLRRLVCPPGVARLNLSALDRLDTSGAMILRRTREQLATDDAPVEISGASDHVQRLLALMSRPMEPVPSPPQVSQLRQLLASFGGECTAIAADCRTLIGELGLIVLAVLRTMRHPRRLRGAACATHIEQAGITAIPIVGLLPFLVGIVIAFQSGKHLAKFGAEIITTNMVGLMFLRELGVLLAAIIVAGRSGAAFAAQIGSMKVSQQIDAMVTMGIDPVEALVLPRVLALMIVLPLLTLLADVTGLLGGGVAMWLAYDISPLDYIVRVHHAIGGWTFAVAMIKAPLMGAVIAVLGCSSGMRVSGGAEAVGRETTSAVVKSIFAVILLDAVFVLIFGAMKL